MQNGKNFAPTDVIALKGLLNLRKAKIPERGKHSATLGETKVIFL